MMYELVEHLGYLLGQGTLYGTVAGVGVLVGWKLYTRIRRFLSAPWRQPKSVLEGKVVEVHAHDVQFWLDRRANGTPGERAIATQMLDFLGYVEPARENRTVVIIPNETNRDRQIRLADQHAQQATNRDATESWRQRAQSLRAERDASRPVRRAYQTRRDHLLATLEYSTNAEVIQACRDELTELAWAERRTGE